MGMINAQISKTPPFIFRKQYGQDLQSCIKGTPNVHDCLKCEWRLQFRTWWSRRSLVGIIMARNFILRFIRVLENFKNISKNIVYFQTVVQCATFTRCVLFGSVYITYQYQLITRKYNMYCTYFPRCYMKPVRRFVAHSCHWFTRSERKWQSKLGEKSFNWLLNLKCRLSKLSLTVFQSHRTPMVVAAYLR